ncbi:hypothetical protein F4861DRAFT_551315 [Xylaria intraflava]|nr:hypothetical protein F4861DRAFT_551315 [Xylaria intraflava]
MRYHPYNRQGHAIPDEGRNPHYKGKNYDPNYHVRRNGGHNRNPHQDGGHPRDHDNNPGHNNGRYKGRNYDHYDPDYHNRNNYRDQPPRGPRPRPNFMNKEMSQDSPRPPPKSPRRFDQPYDRKARPTNVHSWSQNAQQQQRREQVWAQFRCEVRKMLTEDADGDVHMCSCRNAGSNECYHGIMVQYQKRLTLFTHLQYDIARFVMFLASKGPGSPAAIRSLAKEFIHDNKGSPLQAIIEAVLSGGSSAQLGAMGLGIDFLTDDMWNTDAIC